MSISKGKLFSEHHSEAKRICIVLSTTNIKIIKQKLKQQDQHSEALSTPLAKYKNNNFLIDLTFFLWNDISKCLILSTSLKLKSFMIKSFHLTK